MRQVRETITGARDYFQNASNSVPGRHGTGSIPLLGLDV